MADRRVTLIELVHWRTGSFQRTGQVVAFVQAWGVVRDSLGREPTMGEYIEYWKQPSKSAYRELERFREAFPELSSPSDVLDAGTAVPRAKRRRRARTA